MRFSVVLTILLTAAAASAKTVNVPVEYYRLPNGLKVVISESHAAPTVTVAVYYGVGFRIEPKGQTGFAHLFEHMMFQGSANVKKMEHAKIVEANGGNLNGSTRLDFTNFFEWLDLWIAANQNWFNAHNFYGDLHDIEAAKIADVRQFFKTYYAPNNAVLAIVGDVDPAAVKPMVQKYFADIPLQSVPERPDISEPQQQTQEKRLKQTDKLANVPALAFA